MIVLRNSTPVARGTDPSVAAPSIASTAAPPPGLPDQGGNNTSNKNDQGTDEGEPN
jgi:hypothetical protein